MDLNEIGRGGIAASSFVDFKTEISYYALKEHIKINHPYDNVKNDRISFCAELSGFPCSKCCYRTDKYEKIVVSPVQ